jgi:hypothetical protein
MPVKRPLVRHFIACERVERAAAGGPYTLHNLTPSFQPVAGTTYPFTHPKVELLVVLTDGQGSHPFSVRVVTWNAQGKELSLYATKPITVDLGQDPLIVHVWTFRVRRLPFAHPGMYEFRLLCGTETIAQEPILLREAP